MSHIQSDLNHQFSGPQCIDCVLQDICMFSWCRKPLLLGRGGFKIDLSKSADQLEQMFTPLLLHNKYILICAMSRLQTCFWMYDLGYILAPEWHFCSFIVNPGQIGVVKVNKMNFQVKYCKKITEVHLLFSAWVWIHLSRIFQVVPSSPHPSCQCHLLTNSPVQ